MDEDGRGATVVLWACGDGFVETAVNRNPINATTIQTCMSGAEKIAGEIGHQYCFWIPWAECRPDGFLGTFRDISELLECIEQLKKLLDIDSLSIITPDTMWSILTLVCAPQGLPN